MRCRRSGQVARNADPEKLTSMSGISQAYVRKLHALSCLLDQADDRDDVAAGARSPGAGPAGDDAARGRDPPGQLVGRHRLKTPAVVRRLNPAFANGRIAQSNAAAASPRAGASATRLRPRSDAAPMASAPAQPEAIADASPAEPIRSHPCRRPRRIAVDDRAPLQTPGRRPAFAQRARIRAACCARAWCSGSMPARRPVMGRRVARAPRRGHTSGLFPARRT